MHFTWEVSAGQVIVGIPLIWIIFQLGRILTLLMRFRIEHEILMNDWAARQDPVVRVHDLPTRQSKWW